MRSMIAALIVLIGLGAAGPVRADWVAGVLAYDIGDYVTAMRKLRPLAEQGHMSAQHFLGLMYTKGQGVPQDNREALKWYRMSAEQGGIHSQLLLGIMYDKGEGVYQDNKEALKWYRRSAEQGLALAQTNLGAMYEEGQGVLQDSVIAHMWYNIAGADGSKTGRENRALIQLTMTPAQIAEAQNLARECMKKEYKGCGR